MTARDEVRDEVTTNPNSLHDFHRARRGPQGIPSIVKTPSDAASKKPKDPGHSFAITKHISFELFDQKTENAPFAYEYFLSLPPAYQSDQNKTWPLILFLHGSGESQHQVNESYASIRHGLPKVVLCYDRLQAEPSNLNPNIDIPIPPHVRQRRGNKQMQQVDQSSSPVPAEVCRYLAENFITLSPSLNMKTGYGWSSNLLVALLDEIETGYRVNSERVHVTGFSMGGYGAWELALTSPQRFASVMPICGGGKASQVGSIKHIPHWVHHGDLDDIIPVEASVQMVDALKRAGAKHVSFTRYPDQMHDSWTKAYNNIEVYKWMSKCQRQDVKGEDSIVNASSDEP